MSTPAATAVSSWWRLSWIASSRSQDGKREEKPVEPVAISRKRVQRRIVRREEDSGPRLRDGRDEAVLVGSRVGHAHRLRVARAEPERARAVIEGENGDPGPPERANRGQAVDPADVEDEGFHLGDSRSVAVLPEPSHRAVSRYARPRSPR